jgi:hypothetical protein
MKCQRICKHVTTLLRLHFVRGCGFPQFPLSFDDRPELFPIANAKQKANRSIHSHKNTLSTDCKTWKSLQSLHEPKSANKKSSFLFLILLISSCPRIAKLSNDCDFSASGFQRIRIPFFSFDPPSAPCQRVAGLSSYCGFSTSVFKKFLFFFFNSKSASLSTG